MKKLIVPATILITLFSLILLFSEDFKSPIKQAYESFDSLQNYRVTIKTLCCDSDEEILYVFQKPGFIRMDFINPHQGAVLVYNLNTNDVRLKPFGLFSFFKLTLDPDNNLITSPKGHTVDQSDMSFLIRNIDSLMQKGTLTYLANEEINKRPCTVFIVAANDTFNIDGINSYKVWLDSVLHLPLKAEAFDTNGVLLESVLTADLELNVQLAEDYFDL